MVYADTIFVRWKHVVTVFPSIKYVYLYSHHCTSGSSCSSSEICQQENLPFYHENKNRVFCLLSIKLSDMGKVSSLTFNSSSTSTAQSNCNQEKLSNLKELTKCNHLFENESFSAMKRNFLQNSNFKSVYHQDILIDNLVFNNSMPIPEVYLNKNNFVSKETEKELFLLKFSFSNTAQKEKQPADDPKEKIRMLAEKIRTEAPMLLTKTTPYHDFTMYTDGIELYFENTFKKRLLLRGRRKYKAAVSFFRNLQFFRLIYPELEVIGIRTIEEQSTIEVRWRISGWSRLSMLYTFLLHLPANQRYSDYVSTLHVNDFGLVWRHEVSKMRHLKDALPLREKLRVAGQNAVGAAASMKSYFVHEDSHVR